MKGNSGTMKLDWKKLAAIEVNRFEHDLENNSWSVEEIGNIISYSFIDMEFVSFQGKHGALKISS